MNQITLKNQVKSFPTALEFVCLVFTYVDPSRESMNGSLSISSRNNSMWIRPHALSIFDCMKNETTLKFAWKSMIPLLNQNNPVSFNFTIFHTIFVYYSRACCFGLTPPSFLPPTSARPRLLPFGQFLSGSLSLSASESFGLQRHNSLAVIFLGDPPLWHLVTSLFRRRRFQTLNGQAARVVNVPETSNAGRGVTRSFLLQNLNGPSFMIMSFLIN